MLSHTRIPLSANETGLDYPLHSITLATAGSYNIYFNSEVSALHSLADKHDFLITLPHSWSITMQSMSPRCN